MLSAGPLNEYSGRANSNLLAAVFMKLTLVERWLVADLRALYLVRVF